MGVKDPVRGCRQRERNRKRAEVEETDMRGERKGGEERGKMGKREKKKTFL